MNCIYEFRAPLTVLLVGIGFALPAPAGEYVGVTAERSSLDACDDVARPGLGPAYHFQ